MAEAESKKKVIHINGAAIGEKRKTIEVESPDDATVHDKLEIIPLGAGQEVGRSCILLKFKQRTIMLDCGAHPGKSGLDSLPFFDYIEDASEIDLLLVTHFHVDHCASLPYFMEKTNFGGRVFMTHPTKAIYRMILADFVRISSMHTEDVLFTQADLDNTMDKIEVINFHQELEVNGVKFWAYNAGHVLGAAMFMLDIDGVKILYTGDYSREEDRHLMAAEMPSSAPDVLIVEATFGKNIHEPRLDREARFTGTVYDIVKNRRGRCLIPVFALGRVQELLLILDEYWEAHPELQSIPIYYASELAHRCLAVYRTYSNMMNDKVKEAIAVSNPFDFKYITNMHNINQLDDSGPCVVFAAPGMLQSGMSRQLFEKWCGDRRNGVIIPGYAVDGTLAKEVVAEPKEIITESGLTIPLRMSVGYISFSAHADYAQTSEFIEQMMPPHVVLVHGESAQMGRLKGALLNQYRDRIDVFNPRNCQPVALSFRGDKSAKTVGQLAAHPPQTGQLISGLLVRRDFTHQVMLPSDLHTYTQLSTSRVKQRLRVPFYQPFAVAARAVEKVFGQGLPRCTVADLKAKEEEEDGEDVGAERAEDMMAPGPGEEDEDDDDDEEEGDGKKDIKRTADVKSSQPIKKDSSANNQAKKTVIIVHPDVFLIHDSDAELVIQWTSTPVTDMVADAIGATLLQLQTVSASTAAETATVAAAAAAGPTASGDADVVAKLGAALNRMLANFFEGVSWNAAKCVLTIGKLATVNLTHVADEGTASIACEDPAVRERLGTMIAKVQEALTGVASVTTNKAPLSVTK